MKDFRFLHGVFAAMVTPIRKDFSPDLGAIPRLLDFLAGRGCHGALLLGTTGEGPSFSPGERAAIYSAAADWRRSHPDFRLLAGTGTPSLQETIEINRAAFSLGIDGVVTLPPYYFRSVQEEGLFQWFSQVLEDSVPSGGALLGYHFPKVSGVPLSVSLLERLLETYPDRFAGMKDSSGDADFAQRLGERFGRAFHVMTGNDKLLTHALKNQAAGCITAMANIYSPLLRNVWDAYQTGSLDAESQQALIARREILDQYPPAPSFLKALLADQHGFPFWPVRPALLPLDEQLRSQAKAALANLDQ